ncbi:hypothetical protein [Campylobacter sp.]|uniref:hypothetical protein n=1 Tax=Campylobacter sp. TaxID=205 RepID=UPI002AA92BA6|nr:hypothetical protein [Campylobacter sp.]MCI7237062.1 hypothetical protein [Campylobacter sp.]
MLSFALFGSMVGVAMFLYVYFKNLKELKWSFWNLFGCYVDRIFCGQLLYNKH